MSTIPDLSGPELSGLRLPLIVAPMLRVSDLRLTSAALRAGVVGSFPTLNARSETTLREWLDELGRVQDESTGLLCPNLVMADADSVRHAHLIAASSARMVITSVGSPVPVAPLFAEAGIAVFADVATVAHARKAVAAGATGLVLLTAGAGGQTGWLNPFAFITAVRDFFDGPVVLAGGMTGGRSIAAARVAGYDLAYSGTPFIASSESPASESYKQEIVESDPDGIMLTKAFTGLQTNMLTQSMRTAGVDPESLDEGVTRESAAELFGNRARGIGPKRWADIHSAGHSVAGVRGVRSVEQIVDDFARGYDRARA
ncbi:MAG: NAD(P)H-dependent flavin oxidoreductase [Brevibacterium yomogidense]|uniref:NAD(P)H-dependent flavin oxidoreductase n=1 Tax=Brevibacterium sp. Mu109 TaxID=1255669 RepID=UPI000C379911|nr:nitronate monooxygenase [Brevibacterium sp. Mu109]SMX72013.1 nitronate monooxygenase [Brevibacterium sp. Mu109]